MAREWILENQQPLLLEVLSYRGGHHSTSDDSSRYRGQDEIDFWAENNNPITRMGLFLQSRGLWDADKQLELTTNTRKSVLKSLTAAEKTKKPPASQLFTDVYAEMPPHLKAQSDGLQEHLEKHQDKYDLSMYEDDENYEDPALVKQGRN